ncbi:hypothetical protein VOLCADRAFT_103262, partial [Volvox carteri f. nagariensis]
MYASACRWVGLLPASVRTVNSTLPLNQSTRQAVAPDCKANRLKACKLRLCLLSIEQPAWTADLVAEPLLCASNGTSDSYVYTHAPSGPQGLTQPPGGSTAPTGGTAEDEKQSRRIAEGVNEEPLPDVCPFAPERTTFCRKKDVECTNAVQIWPILELISVPMFAILLGLSYVNLYQINKWFPTIVGITLAFTALVGRWVGEPAVAPPLHRHYARYPKFDRGGSLLWRHTPSWRRTSDLAALGWFSAFTVITLLTLAPELTGHHRGSNALNVIFNYISPAVFVLAALIYQQTLGDHYRRSTVRNLDRYFGRTHISQVPAGGQCRVGGDVDNITLVVGCSLLVEGGNFSPSLKSSSYSNSSATHRAREGVQYLSQPPSHKALCSSKIPGVCALHFAAPPRVKFSSPLVNGYALVA